MKQCNICHKELPQTEFFTAKVTENKTYYRLQCKKCTSKIRKKRRNEIKNWFNDWKKTLHCKKCGNDDWRVLEFHHRNREEKEFAIGAVLNNGISKEKLMAEANKCDVLCANCHRITHWEENNKKYESINSEEDDVRSNGTCSDDAIPQLQKTRRHSTRRNLPGAAKRSKGTTQESEV